MRKKESQEQIFQRPFFPLQFAPLLLGGERHLKIWHPFFFLSWLLALTLVPSNQEWKTILNICVSRKNQSYKKCLIWTWLPLWTFLSNIWEVALWENLILFSLKNMVGITILSPPQENTYLHGALNSKKLLKNYNYFHPFRSWKEEIFWK